MKTEEIVKQKYPSRMLKRPCPVCQSTKGIGIGKLKYAHFDDAQLQHEFDVVACDTCGFVFLDTASTQADYDLFYQESFYSTAFLVRQIPPEEQQYFEDTVELLADVIPDKRKKIFDIGCGVGALLKAFHHHGYEELYAVDPSISCINEMKKLDFIHSEIGFVTEIPFPKIKAEFITLAHIIEHIIDIRSVMQSLSQKLAGDGLIYIEVPDATRYQEFNPSSPLRFFYFQHVIHFSAPHLRNLLAAHGFNEVRSGKRDRVDSGFVMPCLWGVYRNQSAEPDAIQPDFELALQIGKWFDDYIFDPSGILTELAQKQTPIYLWGVGIHTQMMLAMSPLGKCNIKYLVDKDERVQSKTIAGNKIHSIDKLREASSGEVVIIGPITHGQAMRRYLLEEIGFTGQTINL